MRINNNYNTIPSQYLRTCNPTFSARIAKPVNMSQNIIDNIVNGQISKHFVPTPSETIELMIKSLGEIRGGDKILEPSAGYGHIVDKLISKTTLKPCNIDVIEPVEDLRRVLHGKGYKLVDYDILKYKPKEKYDKIIMNPPFDNGKDILHLLHCYNILKPGGKLVCILPKNVFIPTRQPGYEKWLKDWLGTGEKREINEYLESLLKTNEHKVINLGKVFKTSDVPDDVETSMVLITKNK